MGEHNLIANGIAIPAFAGRMPWPGKCTFPILSTIVPFPSLGKLQIYLIMHIYISMKKKPKKGQFCVVT